MKRDENALPTILPREKFKIARWKHFKKANKPYYEPKLYLANLSLLQKFCRICGDSRKTEMFCQGTFQNAETAAAKSRIHRKTENECSGGRV